MIHIQNISETKIYDCWKNMRRNHKTCAAWKDFKTFYKDMGSRPEGLTLGCIDKNAEYCPNNCEWITRKEQQRRTRSKTCGPCRPKWFYGHGTGGGMIVANNQNYVAGKLGLHQSEISRCLLGKCKEHRSWTFKFIDDVT